MKKSIVLSLATLIGLFHFACKQHATQNNSSTTDTTKTKKMALSPIAVNTFTLNGIPVLSANAMVQSFRDKRGSYDKNHPTCIWFNRATLQTMYNIISSGTTFDGIRLYFAKTIPDSRYTLVAVSTTDGGLDTTDTDGIMHIHNDYFQTTDPASLGPQPGGDMSGSLGDVTPLKGALLYLPYLPNAGLDACGPNYPYHYITLRTAYEMVYKNTGNDEINANSEWFDKGIIGDLLKIIPTNGGLRIYYGRRSIIDKGDTVKRHCFVLIATKPILGVQTDSFVCLPLNPFYSNTKYLPLSTGGGTDNGQLCPNHCSGTTLPQP